MKTFFVVSGFLIVPLFASAQDIGNILNIFSNILNSAIPVVLALAVLYFFWGLAQYILNSNDEAKKAEGRNIMIWGIIALFVMVSVWGLIGILQQTFNVDGSDAPTLPSIDFRE
jgi:ethanolamine transporter EutH